jgi:hypothetical protein
MSLKVVVSGAGVVMPGVVLERGVRRFVDAERPLADLPVSPRDAAAATL